MSEKSDDERSTHDLTMEEIGAKLKDLEMEILGKEKEMSGPFTPISGIKKRLEELKALTRTNSDKGDKSVEVSPGV